MYLIIIAAICLILSQFSPLLAFGLFLILFHFAEDL
jgi:hypothetical protein